jgi:peptide deformylase
MAIRQVVRYPHPVLKQPAEPVGTITDALRGLAGDLVDTMRWAPATVGLAAPQVGEPIRVFVLDVSAHPRANRSHGLVVLFDPEIVRTYQSDVRREGCLSVPDVTADVRRALQLVIRGTDPDGQPRALLMEGFEARAAQHEVDHLDGTLILDRVGSASDLFPRRVYRPEG